MRETPLQPHSSVKEGVLGAGAEILLHPMVKGCPCRSTVEPTFTVSHGGAHAGAGDA